MKKKNEKLKSFKNGKKSGHLGRIMFTLIRGGDALKDKRGRPLVDPAGKRDKRVTARLNTDTYLDLLQITEARDITLSAYARTAIEAAIDRDLEILEEDPYER